MTNQIIKVGLYFANFVAAVFSVAAGKFLLLLGAGILFLLKFQRPKATEKWAKKIASERF